jgi:uncharacterized phage protein gp47/JayE
MFLSDYVLPSINDLVAKSRAAFRAVLKGSDAWVWPNNVYASAKVIGGMVFEAFGFLGYIQKQMFAFSAPDIESLTNHGNEFNIPQNPSAPGEGVVVITDTGALEVDTDAVLQRSDGMQYIVTAGGSLATAGSLSVSVVAAQDGLSTNCDPGTNLAIISGVTGTAPTAAVANNGITQGADVEDIESYRARILFRKRNPINGGSASDYVQWAGQVSGVSFYVDRPTVFVERLWQGPGTVRVFPLMFDLYANGIPSSADIQRVQDFIETVRPAGAVVTVAAPVAVPVDITISGLTPNTIDVQEAVRAELQDMFKRLSRVAGNDTQYGSMPYLAYPTSFSRSWIWQAIANATGEQRSILNSPSDDVALQAGQMATLGNITFV